MLMGSGLAVACMRTAQHDGHVEQATGMSVIQPATDAAAAAAHAHHSVSDLAILPKVAAQLVVIQVTLQITVEVLQTEP